MLKTILNSSRLFLAVYIIERNIFVKLVDISINNYRQFDEAKLSFEDGITILAGANNSGKTSIITLIKNVFKRSDKKEQYAEVANDLYEHQIISDKTMEDIGIAYYNKQKEKDDFEL